MSKLLYDQDNIKLYNGNCINEFPQMEDKSIDVIFADFPYGNKTQYGNYDDSRENLISLIGLTLPEMLRVGKRVAITPGVANMWLYPEPTWTLSWSTPAGAGSGPWGFCCWQPILVYGKDPYLQNGLGRRSDSITLTESSWKSIHPCPKPVGFMAWLINRISMPNETILDPFCGSGVTLYVSRQMGRKSIGIELEEAYCNELIPRLSQLPPMV